MTQTASKYKFRVSISRDQMQWIMSCPDCPADLRKQIKLAIIKADEGMISPAYAIVPQSAKPKKEISLETKYKLACQYLDKAEPIPEELLEGYNEFRYMNDLMDADESAIYAEQNGF